MKLLKYWCTVLVQKFKKPLTVHFLVVNGSKIGTNKYASLYVSNCKADKVVLKSEQTSTQSYAFHRSTQFYALCKSTQFYAFVKTTYYSEPSSHLSQMSSYFFRDAVWVSKFFIYLIDAFFLTGNKNKKIIVFKNFLIFFLIIQSFFNHIEYTYLYLFCDRFCRASISPFDRCWVTLLL